MGAGWLGVGSGCGLVWGEEWVRVGLGWVVGAGWLGVGSGCGLVRGEEWVWVG